MTRPRSERYRTTENATWVAAGTATCWRRAWVARPGGVPSGSPLSDLAAVPDGPEGESAASADVCSGSYRGRCERGFNSAARGRRLPDLSGRMLPSAPRSNLPWTMASSSRLGPSRPVAPSHGRSRGNAVVRRRILSDARRVASTARSMTSILWRSVRCDSQFLSWVNCRKWCGSWA